MTDNVYDFGLNHIIDTIGRSRAKTVGLQVPEGFKQKAIKVSEEIEERTGSRVVISANSCFGACDIDTPLLESVDILFQFGHAEIPNIQTENVFFVEAESSIDPLPVLTKAVQVFGYRVGLVSTA